MEVVWSPRLSIWGAEPTVVLGQSAESVHGVPGHQLAILQRMGVPIKATAAAIEADLLQSDQLIDALIGYSLRGKPSGPIARLISAANDSGRPIAALDIPSGLPGDTGMATDPTIRATTTLTLALPKVGLLRPEARPFVGRLYLADISVPQPVYDRLGIWVGTIFGESDIVRVITAG